MADRVVLHIGTMKSGTSFIQSVLMENRRLLREHGYPLAGRTYGRQSRAVVGVLRGSGKPRHQKRWRRIAQEVRSAEATAGLISMEFLSFADAADLDAILQPYRRAEVEVVLTVRDQHRAIPAQWQTYTRNFGTEDWQSYLRTISREPWTGRRPPRAHLTFHRAQDVVPILERWSAHPLVAGLSVVTVPPPGADRALLWHRFREAARLPDLPVDLSGVKDNPSLGYASCDYLRRLNPLLGDVPPPRYRSAMRPLARDVLGPLRPLEGRPELDQRGAGYADLLNQRIRDAVVKAVDGSGHRARVRLVGSLEDLPRSDADAAAAPAIVAPPPADQVRRAAAAVWDHLAPAAGLGAGSGPTDLDALVADSGRLLRLSQHWDR